MRDGAPIVELRAQGPARYRRRVEGDADASVAIGVQHDDVQVDAAVELTEQSLAMDVLDVTRSRASVRPRQVCDALVDRVDAPGQYGFVDHGAWTVALSGRTEAWRVLALELAHEVALGNVDDGAVADRACRLLLGLAENADSDRPLFAVVDLVEEHYDAMDDAELLADRALDRMGDDTEGDDA